MTPHLCLNGFLSQALLSKLDAWELKYLTVASHFIIGQTFWGEQGLFLTIQLTWSNEFIYSIKKSKFQEKEIDLLKPSN